MNRQPMTFLFGLVCTSLNFDLPKVIGSEGDAVYFLVNNCETVNEDHRRIFSSLFPTFLGPRAIA